MSSKLRVGVAGPVGSGKTALVETLCLRLKNNYEVAVVTNDIYFGNVGLAMAQQNHNDLYTKLFRN